MVKVMCGRLHRRGFALMDCLAALALLGSGVFLALAFFRVQVREIRYTQDRLTALLIAQSEIERLHTESFDAIDAAPDQPLDLSLPSAKRLKGAAGTLSVEETEAGLKKAVVRIQWRTATGRPLHLTLSCTFSRERMLR